MSTRAITLADQVTAAINASPQQLLHSFTAVRRWRLLTELPALDELRVTVAVNDSDSEPVSRDSDQEEFTIVVGIEKRLPEREALDPDDIAKIDALAAIVQGIDLHLNRLNFDVGGAAGGPWCWQRSRIDPVCHAASLKDRVFFSIITLHYTGVHTPPTDA